MYLGNLQKVLDSRGVQVIYYDAREAESESVRASFSTFGLLLEFVGGCVTRNYIYASILDCAGQRQRGPLRRQANYNSGPRPLPCLQPAPGKPPSHS